MSTKIKGLLPRVALRIKDSATGSYPSNARTGDDSRTGKYNVFYDDSDIIFFQNESNIITERNGYNDSILATDATDSVSLGIPLIFGKRDPHFHLSSNRGLYDKSSSLIGHWGFSPNNAELIGSTLYISSIGGSADSTLTGTFLSLSGLSDKVKPRSGSNGSIVSFRDNDFAPLVKVEDSLALSRFVFGDGSSDETFSISTWVKLGSPSSTGRWFVSKQNFSGSAEYAFGLRGDSVASAVTKAGQPDASGSLFLRLYDDSTGASYEARTNLSQASIQSIGTGGILGGYKRPYPNEWIHFVATYDGTGDDPSEDVRFYINGIQILPDTGSIVGTYVAMEDTGVPLYIGCRTESGSLPIDQIGGEVSDTAIFGSVLTDLDVKEMYGFRRGLSMPTGLPANSRFLTENLRTDIFVPQAATRGIIDNFVSFTPGESITPFNESFRPEQSRSDNFYLTGTSPEHSSLGFSSKLASKTQIKMEFSINEASIMTANSASIVYYNKETGNFDLAGGSEATSDGNANEEVGMAGRDCKLFNAIGMSLMSGTSIPASPRSAPSPYHGISGLTTSTVSDKALAYKQSQSVPLNPLFEATPSQLIPLSGVLSAPFLLEKAVIELPISSSDGWFNDNTFGLVEGIFTFSDLGGPCVTVCLMNQLASDRRDLILSATIIPEGDNISFTRLGLDSILSPAGFASFATPNAIVNNTGPQTVTLQAPAAIANGVISPAIAGVEFADAVIGEVNPFGRSFDARNPSARSYFGKEYAISPFEKSLPTRYDESIFSGSSHGNLYIFEKQEISPYLLFPTDNLILGVSKYRAVMTSMNTRNSVTSSHEFGFPTGTIKMTLYGSLVRENEEFHDTLNQNLTSDAIHELIHYDNPVIDQFDIEPKSSFSGSYISEFFTGSIFSTVSSGTEATGYLDRRRGLRSSNLGTSHTLVDSVPIYAADTDFYVSRTGFNRSVSLFSENERYYDTLLPRPDEISAIEGADILHEASTGINYYLLGRGESYLAANWANTWEFMFPFEAKYSTVTRTTTPFKGSVSTLNTSLAAAAILSDEVGLYRPESINNTVGAVTTYRLMNGPVTNSVAASYTGMKNDVLGKALYAIGDGQYGEPVGTSLFVFSNNIAFDVIPRGFKYGILNTNPEKKKWKFRRDRYGQFRDMIEQSRDSKIFLDNKSRIESSPVRVTFVGVSGSVVDGETTFSSNLSLEATSSVPYFDHISRNRGSLPSTENV